MVVLLVALLVSGKLFFKFSKVGVKHVNLHKYDRVDQQVSCPDSMA